MPEGIAGEEYGYGIRRSRRWVKHEIKDIPEERFHNAGNQQGSGCGGH